MASSAGRDLTLTSQLPTPSDTPWYLAQHLPGIGPRWAALPPPTPSTEPPSLTQCPLQTVTMHSLLTMPLTASSTKVLEMNRAMISSVDLQEVPCLVKVKTVMGLVGGGPAWQASPAPWGHGPSEAALGSPAAGCQQLGASPVTS